MSDEMSNIKKCVTNWYTELCEIFEIEPFMEESKFGLYVSCYLIMQDIEMKVIPEEMLVDVSDKERSSLLKFGFKLDNQTLSPDVIDLSRVILLEFDSNSDNYLEEFVAKMKKILKNEILNSQYATNYILLCDDGTNDGINYSEVLPDIIEKLIKNSKTCSKIIPLEYNIRNSYLGVEHQIEIIRQRALDIEEYYDRLPELIDADIKLDWSDIYISQSLAKRLNKNDFMYLAYLSLRWKLNIVTTNFEVEDKIKQATKFLFSGKYLCVSDFIKYQKKLDTKLVVISTSRADMLGVTKTINNTFYVKAIKLSSIINKQDIETISILMSPIVTTITDDDFLDFEEVIKDYSLDLARVYKEDKTPFKSLEDAISTLIYKLQMIAVRLCDSILSLKEIVFFEKDNEVYMTGIRIEDIEYDKRDVVIKSSLNNNEQGIINDKVKVSNLLPTQVFNVKLQGGTEYEFPKYNSKELQALVMAYNHENVRFNYMLFEYNLRIAIFSQEILKMEKYNTFRDELKSLDPNLVRGLKPEPSGKVDLSLIVSP